MNLAFDAVSVLERDAYFRIPTLPSPLAIEDLIEL